MPEIVRDYLALPEMQFMIKHWAALLCGAVLVYAATLLCLKARDRTGGDGE